MLFGTLLSTFLSGNSLVSWGIVKSWFLVPLILFFLAWQVIEKEKINRIFMAYFFSAFFVALISCGYYLANFLTYDNRLAGIFNSPNYLAMYLAPAIVIFIFQKNKVKSGYFLFFVPIVMVLFLTYSYSAWFSILTSLIILVLIKNKNISKKIAIIGIIILALFLSQLNNKKMIDLLTANSRSSLASRMMIWKASVKIIEDNFIFGIGPGNFQKTYLEYQKFYPPYLEWAVPHPNNLYLTWWLYGGIMGMVGFLGLAFFFLRDVSREVHPMEYPAMRDNFTKQNLFHRVKKEPNDVLFVALGIMLIILIHGIFDTTYFKNDLAIIFWLNFLVLK